jgi:hypothetical protein
MTTKNTANIAARINVIKNLLLNTLKSVIFSDIVTKIITSVGKPPKNIATKNDCGAVRIAEFKNIDALVPISIRELVTNSKPNNKNVVHTCTAMVAQIHPKDTQISLDAVEPLIISAHSPVPSGSRFSIARRPP